MSRLQTLVPQLSRHEEDLRDPLLGRDGERRRPSTPVRNVTKSGQIRKQKCNETDTQTQKREQTYRDETHRVNIPVNSNLNPDGFIKSY